MSGSSSLWRRAWLWRTWWPVGTRPAAPEFLILDEVFGSQAAERRESILTGLRTLRAMYGQILLISHVGGLDEAADRVLEVGVAGVDGHRAAEVTAA